MPTRTEELTRLRASAEKYQVGAGPEEAVVRLDEWWIDRYVTGPALLELGSADGVSTAMLLKRAEALDVVEGSAKYCELVKERIPDQRVSVHNRLYEEFTPSRCYDDIVCARSLEVVESPVHVLSRIRHWLKPQGRLHIVVQNAESLHRRIGCALGMLSALDAISEPNRAIGNRRIYTKATLQEQIQEAGLAIELVAGYMLKPFDYDTMAHAAVDLTGELIPALYRVGQSVPEELRQFWYAQCVRCGE